MKTALAGKGPMGLNGLTARDAAARIEAGTATSEELVRDCLARIEAREPDVQAWDYLDPAQALEQARLLDRSPRRGPLHGVPVGIKDIFDTVDMPTAHGFAPYEGRRWGTDSNCVAALRAGGMLILGKTVTTQFASPVPRKTRNPHDPERTPGVSSSGSAAAVADFMVPLANGSQTGSSVTGPAACCGVYGYKASLDGIDRGGFRHCKPSIDTIGLFARSIDDLILLRAVQTGSAPAATPEPGGSLRVGIVYPDGWDKAEPCMHAAMEQALTALGKAGTGLAEVALPRRFAEIVPAFSVSNGWEGAAVLDDEMRDHLEAFNDRNRERVDFVRGLSREDYVQAKRTLDAARGEMDLLFGGHDVFVSPSLPGEAPKRGGRGQPADFVRLWSHMYTPTVHLPLFVGPHGLPLGLQVIGPRGSDDATLAAAHWIDARIREDMRDGTPPPAL